MRYVVGIDPSLVRTGITVLGADDDGIATPRVLRSFGFSLANTSGYDEQSDRIVFQAQSVAKILDKLDTTPELALIEKFIPPTAGPMMPSYVERCATWYAIWSLLRARGIPRSAIVPGTLKKWATGRGDSDKAPVLEAVQSWWPSVPIRNHDVADSAVCASMCAMKLGWELPFLPRRRHYEGLTTVWPGDIDVAVRAANLRAARR